MVMKLFTWWNGATIGTLFDLFRRAREVGRDDYGNRYFEERKASFEGRPRRYVIYRGLAEPSKVPPDWFGWLHHTLKEPPTEAPLPRRTWETDHTPNMTGTVFATRPRGALSNKGERQASYADYDSWSPDA